MKKFLSLFLVFFIFSFDLVSQTKYYTQNDGKGLVISNSGGIQSLWNSKAKIIKSKNWGDDFFYVIWADTGTYMGHSPFPQPNASQAGLPNASIFAVRFYKNSENLYIQDSQFGTSGVLVITDRYDQSIEELIAYPYNNGFTIVYSTSSQNSEYVTFFQYYDDYGYSKIIGIGDGSLGNTSFKINDYTAGVPFIISGNKLYYVLIDGYNMINIKYCDINSPSNCTTTNTNISIDSIIDGFIVPSYDKDNPGIIVGFQKDWEGNGRFNIKITRISPSNSWGSWIYVSTTNSVYIQYDQEDGKFRGGVKAFSEENGSVYILWLDTAPINNGYDTGLRFGKFYGTEPVNISTNGGIGFHIADISISSMSVNLQDNDFYVNSDIVGITYFNDGGKFLKIFDFSEETPSYKKLINLSQTDYNPKNYYFSINDFGNVAVFKRNSVMDSGGSLYFSAYDKDFDEIFPFNLVFSSSSENSTRYSYLNVFDIGKNFLILEHEETGIGPWSYNLYLQMVSTYIPPLENLSNLSIIRQYDDPLMIDLKAVDINNIVNSTYVVQISTSPDFLPVIYSVVVLNDNNDNPKTLLTLSGLTHGKTYYFRTKVIFENRESNYVTTSYSYGVEAPHISDMSIGRWSNIRNSFIPLSPYSSFDWALIDGGNNNSFYFWQHYLYSNDSFSIKVAKYNSSGNKIFEKEIIKDIKYIEGFDNGFNVNYDGNGGFVVLWTYASNNNNYAKMSSFNANGEKQWEENLANGDSIYGVDKNFKIVGNSAFVFYADNSARINLDIFSLTNGNKITKNLNLSVPSNQFFISVTTTSDNSIIMFYGETGTSGYLNAKKIDSSGNIIHSKEGYTGLGVIASDNDLFAISDNQNGAYFIYPDSSGDILKILRVNSSLQSFNGYPMELGPIYETTYGEYKYYAGYTPYGPVISYLSSSTPLTSKITFWSNQNNNSYQTYSYNLGFNRFKIAYNSNHNLVSVAGSVNDVGKEDVYIFQYKANNATLDYGPFRAVKNLYGFSLNYPVDMILTSVDDYFMLGNIYSESSYIQQISTYATLNSPTNLSASLINKNSIVLSWTENNSEVSSWYIRYSTNPLFLTQNTTITYITQNPYTIENLSANTTYYFNVRTSSGNMISNYSEMYIKSTLADIPSNLSIQSIDVNYLTFSWYSNGNGANTLYNIVLTNESGFEVASSTQTALSKTFSNLLPNTTYYAKVRTIGNNIGDITSYTQAVGGKTYITLSDISDITFSDVSNSSIKVSFNHPSGAKIYQIEMSSVSSFNIPSIIITSFTVNKYAVFGMGGEGSLLPNTTYYCRVKAYYDSEQTGYVLIGMQSTNPSQPTSIVVNSISSNSVSVSWNSNSNPQGTRYNVSVINNISLDEVYSSTITNNSASITNLTPNTTYFIMIKAIGNQAETLYTVSPLFKTKVELIGVSNVNFYNIGTSSFTVSWDDLSPGEITYEVNYSRNDYDLLYSTKTKNKYAVFGLGGVGEGYVLPNTTYHVFLSACNPQTDCSPYKEIGSTVTLANVPYDFNINNIYATSATFSWNENSNPQGSLYRIRYISSKGNGQLFFTGNTATITGLKPETNYQFYLAAINHAKIPTQELSLSGTTSELIETVAQIGISGGVIIFDAGSGEFRLNIPAGAFNSNVTFTVKFPEVLPTTSKSLMSDMSLTNIFLEVNISDNIQPLKPVEMIMEYPSTITFPQDTLVISRYDSDKGVWIPYKSYVDKINHKVKAYVDHFSVFGLLSITPSSGIAEPKIAPNPLRPYKGSGYSNMTFSNLPPNCDLVIYDVLGSKVKQLKTDLSGIAVWDGKNEDGEYASSGVYFVLIKNGSSTKVVKIGVQR